MHEMLAEVLSRHPWVNAMLGTTSVVVAWVVPTVDQLTGWVQLVIALGALVAMCYSVAGARRRFKREKRIDDEAAALRRIKENQNPTSP